ncbi:MAG: AAA family ATPase [Thermoguttaceae bacterium]|jgi:mRNA-degrading endonuclease RelE of RelBE toxin-antitoxin system|nr:AAA family ATPase [Thermoguttaceae bacterium]
MPTVAIASEFLDAFARIPRAQQKKVREFTEKFKADPRSSAINYEKLNAVKDSNVRTVRIDQKYRAVVLHPDQGDVYILTWVDNHDEAMDWAVKRTFDINPVTGALQIVSVSEVEKAVQPKVEKKLGLLDAFDDDLLLSFGVPAILLPAVRAIEQADELLSLTKHLPAESAEALLWLAEGIPPEEVRETIAAEPEKKVDTSDLATALQHPDSRRRFVTIQTDHDLNTILNAPLDKWRVFLHPNQEQLVTKTFNGPARVLGGPGTGKTVCAMHRARHLAKTACGQPGDRVLFTTYTANLARNVEENLHHLCADEIEKLEVVHLHSWAVRFMRTQGVEFDIATPDDMNQCWETAVSSSEDTGLDVGFLKQEWDQVVQANNIQDRAAYLKVPRTGRGRALTRPHRARVWQIFETYVEALRSRGKHEWLNVIQETRRFLEQRQPALPYRAVVVDEAQDFHPEEWKLIRATIPPGTNDLFLVGDAHQRIYGRKVVLRQCGINIQGRSSRLKINYRTTEQIRTWAMAMLQGVKVDDLDGEADSDRGYASLLAGPSPEVAHFGSEAEEQEFLGQRLLELIDNRPPEDICVVARTNKMVRDGYQSLLKSLDIKYTLLDKHSEGGGVRLATMHRVKGLEFPVMILAGVNAGVVPLRIKALEGDPASKEEHNSLERSLLFVAATRARDTLIVSSWGRRSPFLPK